MKYIAARFDRFLFDRGKLSRLVIIMFRFILLGTAFLSLAGVPAATQAEVIQFPGNGHYYTRVDTLGLPDAQDTWQAARDAAKSMSHLGLTGYLATITSQAEQDFLASTFGNAHSFEGEWIGGSDLEVDGDWRWMDGPEAGELFWRGGPAGQAFGFEAWAGLEPNNWPPGSVDGEDFLMMGWISPGDWNDQRNEGAPVSGFIVEFSAVPEPSTYALLAIGGAALAIVARRKRA